MHSLILALLFFVVIANGTLAQTVSTTEFKTYQQIQADDLVTLGDLDVLSNAILEKYGQISKVDSFDRSILQLNADKTVRVTNLMRNRGRQMFIMVEQNYNRVCLQAVPDSQPCSTYKARYRTMITNTLVLGGIYYTVTEKSYRVSTALSK